MISIDRVYKTVLMLANSDIRGNVNPTELRLAINDTVNEIYESYFAEITRLVNKQNRGFTSTGLENLTDRLREKVNHFLQDAPLTFVTSLFILPTDCRYIDSVYYNSVTEVDECKNAKEFNLIKNNSALSLTTQYPIYLKQGNTLRIAPNTINNNVTLYYLRKPLLANWTFVVVGGTEIFNPSASDFQDIDLHPSEENNVVLKTLKRFGINLKEEDLQAVTTNAEQTDFNRDNSI